MDTPWVDGKPHGGMLLFTNEWSMHSAKGSRKNKFAFLRVKAPVRQGAEALTYQDISSFRNAAGRDHWPLKM